MRLCTSECERKNLQRTFWRKRTEEENIKTVYFCFDKKCEGENHSIVSKQSGWTTNWGIESNASESQIHWVSDSTTYYTDEMLSQNSANLQGNNQLVNENLFRLAAVAVSESKSKLLSFRRTSATRLCHLVIKFVKLAKSKAKKRW